MQLIRLAACLVVVLGLVTSASSDLSTKEKIRLHKEWLERKAGLKMTNTTSWKNSYFWRSMKTNENRSNDISSSTVSSNIISSSNTIEDIVPTNSTVNDSTNHTTLSNDVYPEYDAQTSPTTASHFTNVTSKVQDVGKNTNDYNGIATAEATSQIESVADTIPTITSTSGESVQTTTAISPSTEGSDKGVNNQLQVSSDSIVPTTAKIETTSRNSTTGVRPVKKPRINKKTPHWGPWSAWSACSRSCGTGVMLQERKCLGRRASNPAKRVISRECAGLYRRYRLCNEQECPVQADFRQQQCTVYDQQLFQGKQYIWEPYIKDDAECELNCKPVGLNYFATMNSSVIDGTPCSRPAEYYRKNYRGRAICVDGICKAIHASGVITGSFTNSGTVPCGGLICRPISGIFTKNPLPSGYVHVATIPAGSSNISITELKNSINYLVLKSNDQKFVINGDYSVSPSGVFEAGGAIFEYQRIDGLNTQKNGEKMEGVTEWITCVGPTMEAVHLMVLGQDPNPGIKYEYLLPLYSNSESDEDFLDSSVSGETDYPGSSNEDGHIALKSGDMYPDLTSNRPVERRRRRFMWKVVGFSPCSKSCGGGTQTPIIRCVREAPTRYFSPRRCAHSEKPILNENILRCNTQPCPAYWRLEEWGDCNCAESEGYRQREVRCVQELAAGIVIQVNSAACMEEEPPTKKRCDCPKLGRRRSHRQRLHEARASEYLISNSSTPRHVVTYENDKAGVWLMSDWNQHCSVECGTGLEYRSIFCDRTPPNIERCDLRATPDTTRVCENEKNCGSGEWFTSPWSQCNGDCFNLTRTRQVICIRNQLIVEDEECEPSERPLGLKNCTSEEVEYCRPRWHYSEWTECSKSCDGGTQRRSVKCLELDLRENTLRDSKKCRYAERDPIYRSCNTQKCEDPRVDLIQNDIQPTCVDEFPNCHRVAKSHLCSYDYYRKTCCYSCSGLDFDHL